ncbi:MAG: ankyrin repeat domain-containing protein [Burkholderiales bacterium]|nr:ankyrin repeat domain-containing protein [Burkholderiales bacterium]
MLSSVRQEESASPLFYDARIHGDIEGFIQSDLGRRCIAEVTKNANDLMFFSSTKGVDSNESGVVLGTAAAQYFTFSQRLAALDGKGVESKDFLSFGKRALHELCEQIENINISSSLKRGVLVELSRSLTVCAPGVITAIRDAVRNLALTPDLKSALGKLRNQIAVQAVQSEVAKWINDGEIPIGNEVHYVNACLSLFATQFKLDAFEDSLAPSSLPQECLDSIKCALTNLLEEGALLIKFSDDYQHLVKTRLYESLQHPFASDLQCHDYTALKDRLDVLLHEEFPRHGFYIEPEALFELRGGEEGAFDLSYKSNKILQKLVLLCKGQQLFDEAPVEIIRITSAENGALTEPLNFCCMGDREWVETGSLLPDSEHREYVRDIELNDRFWLFDQIGDGKQLSMGFSKRICDLFTGLTSTKDVTTLAMYFSQRLRDLKFQGATTVGQVHELICKQLLRDSRFDFKQQFLESQLLHWPDETLFYCFDDEKLHCHLLTALKTGFSTSLVDKNGHSFLQRAANTGLLSLFATVITDFDCNPFLINVHGTAFSEHANSHSLQTFLFGPPLGKTSDLSNVKLQCYFEEALMQSTCELHPKIFCEAGLFLEEGQTLVYEGTPKTARDLLQHAIELSISDSMTVNNAQAALYRSAHLFIAKNLDSLHPLTFPNSHISADPLWAYQKMSRSRPVFALAKVYEYLLSSRLHHAYEDKNGLSLSGREELLNVHFRHALLSFKGDTDTTLLLECSAVLIETPPAGCFLSLEAFQIVLARLGDLVKRQPNNPLAWTVFVHFRFLCEKKFSHHPSNGMSKNAISALQKILSLDCCNAHAWSLLARYLNPDQTIQINKETLSPADCELRSYAYTPIDPDSGATIMHTVAKNRDLDTLRRLQQFGCDINVKDRAGTTPMDIIVGQGDLNIANLMIR